MWALLRIDVIVASAKKTGGTEVSPVRYINCCLLLFVGLRDEAANPTYASLFKKTVVCPFAVTTV